MIKARSKDFLHKQTEEIRTQLTITMYYHQSRECNNYSTVIYCYEYAPPVPPSPPAGPIVPRASPIVRQGFWSDRRPVREKTTYHWYSSSSSSSSSSGSCISFCSSSSRSRSNSSSSSNSSSIIIVVVVVVVVAAAVVAQEGAHCKKQVWSLCESTRMYMHAVLYFVELELLDLFFGAEAL